MAITGVMVDIVTNNAGCLATIQYVGHGSFIALICGAIITHSSMVPAVRDTVLALKQAKATGSPVAEKLRAVHRKTSKRS